MSGSISPNTIGIAGATGGITGAATQPSQAGGIGALTPSAQTMNPLAQGMLQRYSSMSTEQLQQLAAMMGASPQGQIIKAVLNQKLMMPNGAAGDQNAQVQQGQQQQAQQAQAQALPIGQLQGQRRGGTVIPRASGGSMTGIPLSMASPWWARSEARSEDEGGFLRGSTAGRADAIRTSAPGNSYVVPADVLAGLGEGNGLAGARVMDAMTNSGPHGIPQERQIRGRGPPPPPRVSEAMENVAKGGKVAGAGDRTPVDLSDGEYLIPVAKVRQLGDGNLKRGHGILDAWVVEMRRRHIARLKALPGPVKP